MELLTELPFSELVAKFEKGRIGSVKFIPQEPGRLGPRFHWDHGKVVVMDMNDTYKEMAIEGTHMRNPQSLLWFHLAFANEGSDDVYQVAMTALDKFDGDLALTANSNHLLFERVDGKLTVDRSYVPEERRKLFKQPYELTDFPPLP